jgi:hypothetical protein
MPLGPAQLPQEGPKIGKRAAAQELPEHKQAEIGDFEAELQKRGLTPEPPPTEPPPVDPDQTQRIERGIETLEALKSVMSREDMEQGEPQEDPVDPIEELAQPTDEEKQEFVRCILGGRQYTKTFELFGGACKVAMGDLTPKEEEGLYAELAKAELAPGDDWSVLLDQLRLIAYSKGYDFAGSEGGVPVTVVGAKLLVERMPTATYYSAFMRAARIFRRHLEIMLERSLDSDFWRADGSSLPPEPLPEEPSTTDENPEAEAGS